MERDIDSSAAIARAYRPLGLLPFSNELAVKVSGIGEAVLEDGRRVLITMDRQLNKEEQHWYAHDGGHQPVYIRGESCELILGDSASTDLTVEWLYAGLRAADQQAAWRPVTNKKEEMVV